jgi:hypothetical protein
MLQQGQVFKLASPAAGGESLWAYRYRTAAAAQGVYSRAGSPASRMPATHYPARLSTTNATI